MKRSIFTLITLLLVFSSVSVEAKKGKSKQKPVKYKLPKEISYEVKVDDKMRNRFKIHQKHRASYEEELQRRMQKASIKETTKTATKAKSNFVAVTQKKIKAIQRKIDMVFEKELNSIEPRIKRLCDEYAQIQKRLKMTDTHERTLKHQERVVEDLQTIITDFGSEYIQFESPSKTLLKQHPWLEAYAATDNEPADNEPAE